MIKSIPVNIKQASSLLFLCLINCKSLQSLPELPLMLCSLQAHATRSMHRLELYNSHLHIDRTLSFNLS
ncbi:hypothetical protein L3X38_043651 [Prunus dulcis]|uniref:Uncharacterized protein n=1 Tax=Prunus dulcis TaxID=3755 RepID=A0AAD4UWV6_PRUDU|nr:hypothetical protein L3X38_043651 [Prunus dulcis]